MINAFGSPFGQHGPPLPPREPRSRRWKLTFLAIVLVIGFALVMGGTALAHSTEHMVGGCGGGSNPLDNPPAVENPPGVGGQKLSYAYFQRIHSVKPETSAWLVRLPARS